MNPLQYEHVTRLIEEIYQNMEDIRLRLLKLEEDKENELHKV